MNIFQTIESKKVLFEFQTVGHKSNRLSSSGQMYSNIIIKINNRGQ